MGYVQKYMAHANNSTLLVPIFYSLFLTRNIQEKSAKENLKKEQMSLNTCRSLLKAGHKFSIMNKGLEYSLLRDHNNCYKPNQFNQYPRKKKVPPHTNTHMHVYICSLEWSFDSTHFDLEKKTEQTLCLIYSYLTNQYSHRLLTELPYSICLAKRSNKKTCVQR